MTNLNDSLSEIIDIEPIPDDEMPELPQIKKSIAVISPIQTNTTVAPIIQTNTAVAIIDPATTGDKDTDEDYRVSRKTYKKIIDIGQEALENSIFIAKESEHPRAYEVAATLMNSLTEATDRLMDLQKKRRELTQNKNQEDNTYSPQGNQGGININKAVFVGTPEDLLKKHKYANVQDAEVTEIVSED